MVAVVVERRKTLESLYLGLVGRGPGQAAHANNSFRHKAYIIYLSIYLPAN